MRTIVTTFSALALTLALGATAAAQNHTSQPDTQFDFTDADEVLGAPTTPDGVLVDSQRRPMRESLVRPRVHFVPELLKSVERL